MPHPLLISSQSDYLIRVFDRNSQIYWQTAQIQISWLLEKPTDLNLHCLLRLGMSCSAREGLIRNYAGSLLSNTSRNICFGYLLDSPHWGDSNKYTKYMFYEEIRIKHGIFCISFSSLGILYKLQIHFNSNIFGNKSCRCNEGSLYSVFTNNWFYAYAFMNIIHLKRTNPNKLLLVQMHALGNR